MVFHTSGAVFHTDILDLLNFKEVVSMFSIVFNKFHCVAQHSKWDEMWVLYIPILAVIICSSALNV